MSYKAVLDKTQAEAAKIIRPNEEAGDYIGEDGLLYCGKCRTRKQGEYSMPWGVVRPYLLCECAKAEYDRQQEQHKKEQIMLKERERLSALRSTGKLEIAINEICKMICPEARKEVERICFSDSALRQWNFENDDMSNPKLTNALKKYVSSFPDMKERGQGLILYGDVGTGKTYAAVEVANALLDLGYSVLVTNFAKIANTVSGMFEGKQEYFNDLSRFDLLVLDDLGTERKTEYMQEIVWQIIDSRYRIGLPMIITTNLTAEELKKPDDIMSKRIYDRVLEKCLPIEVNGTNRRHKKIISSYDDLRKDLGL